MLLAIYLVSHHLKFLLINLNLCVFSEVHAHDFSLFLIDLKPSFPSIFCEKAVPSAEGDLLLWIILQYHLHSLDLLFVRKGYIVYHVVRSVLFVSLYKPGIYWG